MAAKSKKRLSKIENKLLKLEKLELKDLICSICQSILIEPVTLPCNHDFCQRCFSGSIENNALCCPLCRLRIGSWLRTATKQKNVVNTELWEFIKNKYSEEILKKCNGEDLPISQEKPTLRLSEPGEIRSEYETELKRLRAERIRLEHKHLQETESLIKKIQEEEKQAQQNYLEAIKQDEILAQKIELENLKKSRTVNNCVKKHVVRGTINKPKLKTTKIDGYLSKIRVPPKASPILTDDNTSSDSAPKCTSVIQSNRPSPEMVPSYGKLLKNFFDKKIKSNSSSLWNKENGKTVPEEKQDTPDKKKDGSEDVKKMTIQSLLVSLPLPHAGIRKHKMETLNISLETDSVDSMRQELCYFKPIDGTTPTSFNTIKGLPLKVPGVRAQREMNTQHNEAMPNRAQYLEGLCRLRKLSLNQNLPSAFVIALSVLRVKKSSPNQTGKSDVSIKSKIKKSLPSSISDASRLIKKNIPNKNKQSDELGGCVKLDAEPTPGLRRTRSMGSIKDENELTPKKNKIERKVCSERKRNLRSYSKKPNAKFNRPPSISESINNNKVNLAVKNLSSPLKNCDVKKILQEQIRIEKIIEQEKDDLELARKMDAELNGRRQPRRAAIKRQVTLNYALRPAKKLKV